MTYETLKQLISVLEPSSACREIQAVIEQVQSLDSQFKSVTFKMPFSPKSFIQNCYMRLYSIIINIKVHSNFVTQQKLKQMRDSLQIAAQALVPPTTQAPANFNLFALTKNAKSFSKSAHSSDDDEEGKYPLPGQSASEDDENQNPPLTKAASKDTQIVSDTCPVENQNIYSTYEYIVYQPLLKTIDPSLLKLVDFSSCRYANDSAGHPTDQSSGDQCSHGHLSDSHRKDIKYSSGDAQRLSQACSKARLQLLQVCGKDLDQNSRRAQANKSQFEKLFIQADSKGSPVSIYEQCVDPDYTQSIIKKISKLKEIERIEFFYLIKPFLSSLVTDSLGKFVVRSLLSMSSFSSYIQTSRS